MAALKPYDRNGKDIPPEPPTWGPSMMALSPQQRAFVIAYFTQAQGMGGPRGKPSATAAARAAGYADNGTHAIRQKGHEMLHNPRVQAAMLEHAQAIFGAHNPEMMYRLFGMARAAKSETVKLAALESVLNRGGMAPVQKVSVKHEHVLSFDEKLLELQRLARLNGDDPAAAVAGLVGTSVSDAEEVE